MDTETVVLLPVNWKLEVVLLGQVAGNCHLLIMSDHYVMASVVNISLEIWPHLC